MNETRPNRSPRILVIDDNPAIHEDFRKVLCHSRQTTDTAFNDVEMALFGETSVFSKESGFEIDSAYQGQEGLALVERALAEDRPYALAFVDIRMPPGWDGIETITHLWQSYPELQVVICTAYSDYSWEDIVRKFGKTDNMVILKKPFDNVEVLQLAHALTQKWALSQRVKCRIADLDQMVSQRTAELEQANAKLQLEIVEKAKTEEALRLSEERFSKAFSASPLPMAIQSLDGERYIDINQAFLKMTGFNREEVIKRTPGDLKLWTDDTARGELIRQLRDSQRVNGFECKCRTKAGEVRDTLVSAELFKLASDQFMLVITQDISDQLNLEKQLRQAQKLEAVGQLAAGVAHDFNNILTIIQGHVSLRLQASKLDKTVESSLEQVSSAAGRAAALTRKLLAFSRKQIMQPKPLQVNDVIEHLRSLLARLLGEPIELRLDLTQNLPCLCGDECNLEQVLMNLAVNARDAMDKGGQLTISTELVRVEESYRRRNPEAYPGDFICLSVEDTGSGMDTTVMSRIFEPFFTTKEVGKGSGLGLATVYGIVKQHHGWLEVTSRKGHGSTFKVFLPATTEQAAAGSPAAAPTAHLDGKETILVVEDEALVRELVRTILQEHGYSVLEADNGIEAVKVFAENESKIDLLLTDVVMPNGLTGPALAKKLRARNPKLRVLYTSGYSPETSCQETEFQEKYNYLQKPYDPNNLLRAVRDRLDASSKMAA